MDCTSSFFAYLVIVDWIADIENFTFLSAGKFSISVNTLEFCLGIQLKYLEAS